MTTTAAIDYSFIGSSVLPMDNPKRQHLFVISEEFFIVHAWVSNLVITPILGVTGILGNTFGLWALAKNTKNNRTKMYSYLFTLFSCNILTLLQSFLLVVLSILNYEDARLASLLASYMLIFEAYVLYVLRHITGAMIILMSSERLVALVKPFYTHSNPLFKYQRFIICVISFTFALYMIPFFLGHRITSFPTPHNTTLYTVSILPEYFDVFMVFVSIETLILDHIFPLIVLVVNIMIGIAYWRYKHQRAWLRTNRNTSNQTMITVTSVSVAGTFVILSVPTIFIRTLISTDDSYSFYGENKFTFVFFLNLADLAYRFNAALDFIVYILASRHYRLIIRTVCCKCRHKSNKVTDSFQTQPGTRQKKVPPKAEMRVCSLVTS